MELSNAPCQAGAVCRERRNFVTIRIRALAAAIVGFIGTAVYIGIIVDQGDPEIALLVLWAGIMAGGSLLALIGAVVDKSSVARRLLLVSTIVFAVIGFLAIFSIGLVFVVAAALSGWAVVTVRRSEN
jgi:hypothetical protein